MKRALSFLGILSFAALAACGTPGDLSDRNDLSSPQDDAALYDWLVGEEVPTEHALRVRVSQDRLDEKIDGDPRVKVGVAEPVHEQVDFAGIHANSLSWTAQPAGFGAIRALGTDGFVWSGVVEAPDATAIRLELTDVYIAPDTELWVYSDAGEVFGPYTGEGPRGTGAFSANTLLGEHAWLQLRHEGGDAATALATTRFTIDEVGYLDDRFQLGQRFLDRTHCTSGIVNATCVENAECDNTTPASYDAAIAEMLFQSGRSYYICTGGLIADTANSGTALFLTAHHCISRGREASSLETYWDFKVPCGTTSCDYAWAGGRNTPGASILATGSTGDYSLLLLDQLPDNNRFFMPFDATPVANTNGANLYRNSHPQGAPLAFSSQAVSTSAPTCGTLPRGTFIYSHDTFGATEGGSSGSPVLNSNFQVVGQLYGACGTNLNDVCDDVNNATVDGALAAYYPNVAPYLDPGNACVPVAEDCFNGIDDDCDGLVDANDPDCQTGTCLNPGGAPAGDSCSLNADCCSDKCTGKPGAKSCK